MTGTFFLPHLFLPGRVFQLLCFCHRKDENNGGIVSLVSFKKKLCVFFFFLKKCPNDFIPYPHPRHLRRLLLRDLLRRWILNQLRRFRLLLHQNFPHLGSSLAHS